MRDNLIFRLISATRQTAEITSATPGGELSGSYRYTRVYVRDSAGIWRIVSFEASRIREPNDHK